MVQKYHSFEAWAWKSCREYYKDVGLLSELFCRKKVCCKRVGAYLLKVERYDNILYLDVRRIFESRGCIPLDCFYPRCCSAEAMAVNLFEVEAFETEILKDSGINRSQLVQVQ